MTKNKEKCPVCGMASVTEVQTVVYHKMLFYFCTEQCRETFNAHPNLYSVKGVKEHREVIKQRTMNLGERIDSDAKDLLVSYLMEMMGMKEVDVDKDKVHLTYDLLQVTEDQIEQALIDIGVQLGDGWLERIRRGWVNEREFNELDTMASPEAPCCNKPPRKG